MRVDFLLQTVRRMKLKQVVFRVRKLALKRIPVPVQRRLFASRAFARTPVPRQWFQPCGAWKQPYLHEPLLRREGGATYLFDLRIDAAGGPDWQGRNGTADSFCLYALHSFDYLPELLDRYLAWGDDEALALGLQLVESWLTVCSSGLPMAWDAHPMSKRICNWVRFLDSAQELLPAHVRERMTGSLQAQLGVLAHNLERDLEGNHLIAEARALLIGGLFFSQSLPQAKRWVKIGSRTLEQTLPEQVLADGGHYERSLMYHLVVLWDVLEAYGLAVRSGLTWSEQFVGAILRMLRFTEQCVFPDGAIPPFNDAFGNYVPVARREVLLAGALLMRAEPPCPMPALTPKVSWVTGVTEQPAEGTGSADADVLLSFGDSGFFGYRRGGDMVLWDCGPLGPEENPGHGHADPLHFTWHAAGMPLVIDPGTHTYHDMRWRTYFRGTLAHNCVRIDGQDAAELWGKFRFGRIYSATCLKAGPVNVAGHEAFCFSGTHDGYHRLKDPVHLFRESWFIPGVCLYVRDGLHAAQTHQFDLRYHFHPDVAVRTGTDDGTTLVLEHAGRVYTAAVETSNGVGKGASLRGEHDPPGGWYAPGYNRLAPTTSWSVTGEFRGQLLLHTFFFYPEADEQFWREQLRSATLARI